MDGQGSVRRNIALKLKDSSSQKTTDTSRRKREGKKGPFPNKAHFCTTDNLEQEAILCLYQGVALIISSVTLASQSSGLSLAANMAMSAVSSKGS